MSNDDLGDWEVVEEPVEAKQASPDLSDWEVVDHSPKETTPLGSDLNVNIPAPKLGDKLQELVNPKDPWFKPYQDSGLNINVTTPEGKAELERVRQSTDVIPSLFEAPKKIGSAVLETADALLQPARGVVAGLAARIDAADQPGLTPYQRVNEFLDPEIIRQARKQYEDMGLFNGIPIWNEILRLRFEAAPPIEFWDVLKDSQKADLEAAFKGMPIAEQYENGPRFAAQLATAISTDPLTYASLGANKSKLDYNAMKEFVLSGEDVTAEKFFKKNKLYKTSISDSLEEGVSKGAKSLLSLKVPFANEPFYEYNNIKVAAALDDIHAQMQATLGIRANLRNFSQYTGQPYADDLSLQKNLEAAQHSYQALNHKEQLKALGAYDGKVSRLADFMAEHGDENGLLLAEKVGIKATPEEIQKAQAVNQYYDKINKEGNAILRDAGGPDLDKAVFQAPPKRVQEQIIKNIKETTGLDVPRISVVGKDGKEIDLTFSSQYDYGRALKEEEKEARRIDSNIRSFNKQTQALGLAEVSSNKARNRLSTQAMDAIFAREGIEGAYRSDKANLVLDKFLEKAESARDIKFTNEISKNYGVTPGMEQSVIDAAARRVDVARSMGQIPRYEDIVVSKLIPEDFVKPNTGAFDKVKFDPEAPWAKELETKVFPRPVALKVDQALMPSHLSSGKIASTVEWWQRQWSKNVLTNGVRIGKQAVDNLSRITAINAIPETIREMGRAMKIVKPDWIDEIASKIPSISSESIWSLKDFKGPIKVSAKMITDPEVNNAYNAYLRTLYQSAKKNPKSFYDIQGLVEKTAKGIKYLAELPNENRVAHFVREFGNSADVLTRRAAFRKFMEQGYSTKDSVKMVNHYLMDFENTTQATKSLRYFNAFASFQVKNLESIPKLLATQPVLFKTFKPSDGYLVKAWNDTNGWKPEDYELFQKIFPYYKSNFIGPVLRGQKDIVNNAKWLPQEMDAWFKAGLRPEQVEKMGGMVMSFDVPNFVTAGAEMGDMRSALTSPMLTALQYAAGINPYTGERHTEDPVDNIRNALAAVNPYQFPKIYNKVILPLYNKVAPKAAEALRQGPYSASLEKVFKLEFGKSVTDKVKLDENTIRELTSMKSLGLARVDVHDKTYLFHQMALIKSLNHIFKGKDVGTLYEKIKQGDRYDVLRMVTDAGRIADEIKFNTKVYQDFRNRFEVMHRGLAPDEKQALEFEIQHDPYAQPEEPIEPADDEGEEHDWEEEPQSSMPQPQGRIPASGSRPPIRELDPMSQDYVDAVNDARKLNVTGHGEEILKAAHENVGKRLIPYLQREIGKKDLDVNDVLKFWQSKEKFPKHKPIQIKIQNDADGAYGYFDLPHYQKTKEPVIVLNKGILIGKDGNINETGLGLLRHEWEHLSDALHGRKMPEGGTKPFGTKNHFSRYQDEFEYAYPQQLEKKINMQKGEYTPSSPEEKKMLEDLVMNHQEQDRSPASFAKESEDLGAGMGGGASGSGLGLIGTIGGMAAMMSGKGGAQNAEAGSGSTFGNPDGNDIKRRYATMPPRQLGEQIDSKEKQDEILRRFGHEQVDLSKYDGSHTWSDLDRTYAAMSAKELKKYPPSVQRDCALGNKGYGSIEKVFEDHGNGIVDAALKFGGRWLIDSKGDPIGRVWSQNDDSEMSGYSSAKKLEEAGLLGSKYKIEAVFYDKIMNNGKVYPGDAIGKGTYNTADGFWKGTHRQAAKGGYNDEVSSIGGSMPFIKWTFKPIEGKKK
jgi:hypothetical protein